MNAIRSILAAWAAIVLTAGCSTTQERLLDSGASQSALRSFQSRVFDSSDPEAALRAVIATLQDLDFVIDEADADMGAVSATKLAHYELRVSVSVRPQGDRQTVVRANLQFMNQPVHEPEHYQRFFAALDKALFLSRHDADGAAPPTSAPIAARASAADGAKVTSLP